MSTLGQLWLHRGVRSIYSRLGEFIHLCAIYLGIAVLVTLAAGAVVPSMREQAKEIYHLVMESLRPEVLSNDYYASFGWINTDSSTEPKDSQSSQRTVMPLVSSAYLDFASILEQTAAGVGISGVSRQQFQALRSFIARKYKVANSVTSSLIYLAYVNGREKQIDPLLILAVIAIESSYNPFAESHAGAQGLMQVMTRVHQDKLEQYTEGNLAVFSPEANIKAGTQILYDCKRRRGSITGALACYVGATGPSDGGYGARVLAERRRIALASGIAIRD